MDIARTSLELPAPVLKKVRVKVAQEGTSMRAVMIELLERWVKGDIKLEEKELKAA